MPMLGNEFDDMILTGPCIRCLTIFQFNAHTVPSVSVNPATRCSLNLDGSPVVPGEGNAVQAQLCPLCEPIHRAAAATPARILDLYPHARTAAINFPCECDHGEHSHHRTGSGKRTYCLHQEASGPCPCKVFTLHPSIPAIR